MKAIPYTKKDAYEILHRLRDIPITVDIDDVPVIVSKKELEGLEFQLKAQTKILNDIQSSLNRGKESLRKKL